MDLNEIAVFAKVVEAGSFRAAALALRMPKSTVSRKVADLEERLRARLLQRTTRTLSLTDAGRIFYDYSARIVSDARSAERAVSALEATPRGLLRVTAGVNTSYLSPLLRDYLERYADVRLELYCTDRLVDLVEERFDVGIRAGKLPDSTLLAKSLGSIAWYLVAAPTYLKKRGRPRWPEDMKRHDWLSFGAGSDRATLELTRGADSTRLELWARLAVNDMDILHASTVGALGIALLPAYQCTLDLQQARLERVLPDFTAPSTPIHVVYPSAQHLSPTVKTFVSHLETRMTPPPWEVESTETAT
ncbi:MAG TPA: LysR substrate-binding domain-containing protein [Polyangiaceae bacterium]|jgi:DNA-binding transcriptional LysR family regulator|nr:LysR substrate-binding domain-containing protein [Polyangiaceae bacterium]